MNLVGDSLLGMISAVKPHTERYVPLDTTLSIERTNHAINVLTSSFENKNLSIPAKLLSKLNVNRL